MHPILTKLIQGFSFEGDLRGDITAFLTHHDCQKTAEHCLQVGAKARELAARFGADEIQAEKAGWLHDISAVFPNAERLEAAKALNIAILPEEEEVPLLLHQKLSVVLTREVFGVGEEMILSAVGCHTTLKPNASALDKIVFVADKLAWDQKGSPPYSEDLLNALDVSLDAAALVYQDYLWHSGKMKIVHPWMRESYEGLRGRQGNK